MVTEVVDGVGVGIIFGLVRAVELDFVLVLGCCVH